MAAQAATRESAERVSRCVTALLREQPFFGSLALRLPIRADAQWHSDKFSLRSDKESPRASGVCRKPGAFFRGLS